MPAETVNIIPVTEKPINVANSKREYFLYFNQSAPNSRLMIAPNKNSFFTHTENLSKTKDGVSMDNP